MAAPAAELSILKTSGMECALEGAAACVAKSKRGLRKEGRLEEHTGPHLHTMAAPPRPGAKNSNTTQ
jgi:hypothetical protein